MSIRTEWVWAGKTIDAAVDGDGLDQLLLYADGDAIVVHQMESAG